MTKKQKMFQEKLIRHRQNLKTHFRQASEFLVKCQIIKPYVEKGTLHGSVCPWEIGNSADEGAFPILEDFHDTLEAIWVWSYYTNAFREQSFQRNIEWAWEYIVNNWKRFIGKNESENKSLYDYSHILFSGTFYTKAFNDNRYEQLILQAGNRLENHLKKLKSTEGREYCDPFWMAHCLGLAAKTLKRQRWLKTAKTFVERSIVNKENPFSKAEREPRHKGLGGHDFFSKNANKALASISCLNEETVEEMLLKDFLPRLPSRFVSRHIDENAWNAHLATAIGKAYILTSNERFLSPYFAIMDELQKRDVQKFAALPRSPSFLRRESWVTFFYAHAYSSLA
ncbi:hypothetical protein HXY33_04205 [Candidatus Bathyarchaeota archaeon]|nr:hypothetical protein [Candidatus Bathyarchaeota archaeon]